MHDSAMSLYALLLTSGCALAWATFDAQRKGLVKHLTPVAVTAALAVSQLPLFSAWAIWDGQTNMGPGYWLPGAGVLVANVLASVLFFEAVRRSPLSATVPLLSLTPVFSAIIAAIWLGELLTSPQWIGITMVVLGAFVLNARGSELGRPLAMLGALRREPGSPLMVGVAALWSATAVADKVAMQHTSVAMHATVQVAALAVLLLVWMAARGNLANLGAVRRCAPLFSLATFVGCLALALQLTAITIAHVGLVEAIKRAFGVVAAVVVGRVVFGESITPTKAAAAAGIAAGVALVVA